MRAVTTWITVITVVVGLSTTASAQARRKSLSEMSPEELREGGFEWESQSAFQGSATGGAIAAGPGLIFHGLGHFYSGDADTGWNLLLGEGIGLALGLVGFFVVAATDDASTFNDVGIGIGHLGATMFATGWFIDIIGSLQGNEGELRAPSLRRVPGQATGRYRFLRTDGFEVFHMVEADLLFDLGVVYLRPRTIQDAVLNYQEYGGDLGLRVVEGVDERDYLALELEVDWANFRPGSGAQATSDSGKVLANPLRVDLSVDVSLDLSTFVNHLKHAVQRVELGIGFGRDVGARAFFPGEREKTWLHYEHHLYVNIGRDLVLHPYYEFDESSLVSPISSVVGVFGTALHIVPRKGLTLDLSVAVGDGVTTAAGISYQLF
jgi:hypothetical protein